ncbi:MAG: SMP-30/gluconolactonase/LRE family protein [Betaproteobacteria bacterium]|nr:SMP-30/gluconolactonase/LRE family protein [Betaproteobacteria bacterium]
MDHGQYPARVARGRLPRRRGGWIHRPGRRPRRPHRRRRTGSFTNEAALSADGAWLYANRTFGRRLSRFRVGGDGSLSGRRPSPLSATAPIRDRLAFDAEGHTWITSVVSNRVLRVAPDGATAVILRRRRPGARRAASRRTWPARWGAASGPRGGRAAEEHLEPGLRRAGPEDRVSLGCLWATRSPAFPV